MKPTVATQVLIVVAVAAAAPAVATVTESSLQQADPPAASDPRPLDLDALQRLALQHNPTLAQAQAHVEAERAKAMQAGLYPNPHVGYIAEPLPVAGARGEFAGVFVEQELVSAGKLKLSRRKYEARSLAAAKLAEAQELRVRGDVRVRFFRALGAAEVVRVRQAQLRNAEDRLVTVEELANLGQADATDVHFAKAARQRASLDAMMASNRRRAAMEDLAAVVGTGLGEAELSGTLEGEIQILDFDTALARLLRESPELAAFRQEVAVDEITVRRERREGYPNLRLSLGAGRNTQDRASAYRASVSVEVPLFDRNKGAVMQARADLKRQRAEVHRRELETRRMLAARYSEYLTALQHVRDYREVVLPASREAYEARLLAYQEGREHWPRVLEAQGRYFGERIAYVGHLTEWREGEAAIEGMLLLDGLAAVDGPLPAGHIDAIAKPR